MTKILIVEDEAIIAEDLAAKLTHLGYEIAGTTACGEKAIELAGTGQPDVVFMDISLAGPMDGIAAAEAIRSLHDVPVIYMTAYSDPATLERARRSEPFGYIIKPFDELELPSSIEMALYRHRIDRELRESREDLRHAQFVAHVGSWRLEVRRGTLRWSDETYHIFGIPPGTPITFDSFMEMVHPDDLARVNEKWAAALRGEPYDIEHRIVVGDAVKWVRERADLEFDDQGFLKSGFGTCHDVTEQKEMQRREKEAAIRIAWGQSAMDMINAMHEGVLLLEMDGTIISVNPAVEKLTGFRRGRIVGRALPSMLPDVLEGEDLHRTMQWLKVLAKGGTPDLRTLRMRRRDGETFHVLPGISLMDTPEGGRKVAVLTLKDVTSLHEASRQIEESERKYRELVTHANSMIMRITPEHVITFFNEYAQFFFGFTEEEVLGESVLDTILPPVSSAGRDHRDMIRAITAHPEEHASNENENLCKDGRRVWVHWANRAVRDETGTIQEILCVGTDITERKRIQAQNDLYQIRLRRLAKRLAASEEQERWQISRYIHDTIIQNLSLASMRMDGLGQQLVAADLDNAEDQLKSTRKLVDEAITECRTVMSDLTPALLYELGLVPALTELAHALQNKYGIRINVESDGQPPSIDTEIRGLLFQSTRELVMNALKHAEGSLIQISVSGDGDGVLIRVADDGKGFDPNELEQRDASLCGFGLFSVHERIDSLGGRLHITSAPGQGTSVSIALPSRTP